MTSRQHSARFSAAEAEAWGGLLATFARLDRAVDQDLQTHDGISHSEYEVLLRLSWAEGWRMRINDLAEASLLTRSGVSRLINRLEREGLVKRETAPEDRRGSYAVMTQAGHDAFRRALTRHVAFVRERFHSRLTEAELSTLASVWQKLRD